jgi:hypothetical protein
MKTITFRFKGYLGSWREISSLSSVIGFSFLENAQNCAKMRAGNYQIT